MDLEYIFWMLGMVLSCCLVGIVIIFMIIWAIMPDIVWNLMGTKYYIIHLLSGKDERKTFYVKDIGQTKFEHGKYSWILDSEHMTRKGNGKRCFLSPDDCLSIKVVSKEYEDLIEEIKKNKKPESFITRFPIISRFIDTKRLKNTPEYTGFIRKFKKNPEFIYNASMLWYALHEKFMEKIMKEEEDWLTALMPYLPWICVAVIVCVVVLFGGNLSSIVPHSGG